MIKAVLFDFGGVLSMSGKQGFIRHILSGLYDVPLEQLEIHSLQAAWRRNKVDDIEVLDSLNQRYGKHVTPRMFYEKAEGEVLRSPEVYSLASRLRGMGIKTGILSNIFSVTAKYLRKHGFYDGFDPIVLSCEEGYAKPDPEFYDIAVKRLGLQPDEVLLIDDQEKCRPPAEKLGMQFLLATSPEQIVDDTLKLISDQNGAADAD
jgi:putative hydrolase of the HAD superfamily